MLRFMAFADDGTFIVGRSEQAVRAAVPSGSYDAMPGNYRVKGDSVEARAIGPGGDTMYTRIVSTFVVRATGPESFVREATGSTWTAESGDETSCGLQRYVKTGGASG